MNVIEAAGLGRRYWTTWALRDCTLAIPAGRVAALAGPNGAGKTTLMLAPLDPLARHEFLAAVMETAAEDGTSVLFSSHVVTELERVADYLVVLSRDPRRLAALAWAVGRPHRTLLTWFGLWLLASAAGMLVAGIQLHRLYAAEIQHGCLGRSAWSGVCRPLQSTFGFGWPQTYTLQAILYLQVVPVIIGVFAGAPLLAREYTAGTVRFAWTQGIGRTRWAVATLGLLALAVAVVACLLGLLLQWSLLPVAAQTSRFADRWEPGVFNATPLTAATGSAWLTRLHDSFWVSYQPASRYWVLQLVLAGGTLLAAVALAVATIALIRRRRA